MNYASAVPSMREVPCVHSDILELPDTGEVVCRACHELLPKHCSGPDSKDGYQGLHPLSNFNIGLSSTMAAKAVDYSGRRISARTVSQLIDSSHKAKASTALAKNKFRGTLQLQRICNILELPSSIEEKARETFLNFAQRGYLKGKHLYSCIYGILMITACQEEHPLTLKDILRHTTVSRKRVNADFYTVFQLYQDAPKIGVGGQVYVNRLLNQIDYNWSHYREFQEGLYHTLQTIQYGQLQGRTAWITACLVVYMVLKHYEYPTPEVVLKHTNISRITLLMRLGELNSLYPHTRYLS